MPAPPRALLSSLPKGHEFSPVRFTLAGDDVARYLDAVGDANPLYSQRRLAPPLAAAARALGALLEQIELPGGTLHTGQEMAVLGGVPLGAELALSGRVAQRSERAGMVISVLEFELTPAGAPAPALSGRTTVLAPAGGAQP